jgi:histone H3/H4
MPTQRLTRNLPMSVELESRISREALDLLHCFSEELSEAVLATAEAFARERRGQSTHAIEIDRSDVQKAAEALFACVEQAISAGAVSPSVAGALHAMKACFDQKTR